MGRVNLVFGQVQTGKTTLAWKLTRGLAPRLLVLDPVRSRPLTKAVLRRDALPFEAWTEVASFLASELSSGPWRVILRSLDEDDYAQALAHAPFYRHVTLLVDEGLWFVTSPACKPWLVKCARANAHFGGGIGVPIWVTAQRPMDLPPDIRSQADQIISFRQQEPRDLQFLAERCSPSFAEAVAGLGNHRWAAFPPLDVEDEQDEVGNRDSFRSHRGAGGAGSLPDVPGDERDSASAAHHEVGG